MCNGNTEDTIRYSVALMTSTNIGPTSLTPWYHN